MDEFHVSDRHTRSVSHGDAITGSDGGIGGKGIDMSGAARGQHDGLSRKSGDLSGKYIEHIQAYYAVSLPTAHVPRSLEFLQSYEVDCERMLNRW